MPLNPDGNSFRRVSRVLFRSRLRPRNIKRACRKPLHAGLIIVSITIADAIAAGRIHFQVLPYELPMVSVRVREYRLRRGLAFALPTPMTCQALDGFWHHTDVAILTSRHKFYSCPRLAHVETWSSADPQVKGNGSTGFPMSSIRL